MRNLPKVTQSTPEPGWESKQGAFRIRFLTLYLRPSVLGGQGGEADATVKDHSSISSERERLMLGRGEGATAHRGPHRRGFSQAVHLPSPWGVPATPQTKTPTDLSINKLWQRS